MLRSGDIAICGVFNYSNTAAGGWKLEDKKELGTCLTVFGDGDPEVVVVCIQKAQPIKVPMEVLRQACPAPEPEETPYGTK